MRTLLKWLGFAMVVFGIVCFPFAIWFPGPWATIALLLVMGGCFALVGAMYGAPVTGSTDEPAETDRSTDRADPPIS
jgi:hypothetical protein